jgi:tetratricopeptide (TPR) repeat protein
MFSDHFERALGRYNDIIAGKSRAMLTDDEAAECHALARQMVEQKPNDEKSWYCLAQIELLDEKFNDASKHFKLAFDIHPAQDAEARMQYASALYMSGAIKEALYELQAIRETEVEHDDFMELSFLCYADLGYLSRAMTAFNQIVDPSRKAVYQDLIDDLLTNMPFYGNGGNYSVKNIIQNIKYYPLAIPFGREPLPEVFTHESGQKYYMDLIGGKCRPVSREEQVRQSVLSYLVNMQEIDPKWILVEENLAHMDRDLNRRVDVLVRVQVQNKYQNLLLVECKEPNVPVEGGAIIQALDYNEILACPFILVTNGDVSYCYRRDRETGQYQALKELPKAEDLLKGKGLAAGDLDFIEWQRPPWQMIRELSYIENMKKNYSIIGPRTDNDIAPVLLNIGYGLLDTSGRLDQESDPGGFCILDDLGLCERKIGNPSGGAYNGTYRWIKARDRHGNDHFLYLGVFVTADSESDNGRISGGYTSLVVGIDHHSKPLSVFQLNLNKYLHIENKATSGFKSYRVTHSGIRNRGTKDGLISFVQEVEPVLAGNETISLGMLDDCENFTMDHPQYSDFIKRVIAYSLLRYEMRTHIPKRKKKDK